MSQQSEVVVEAITVAPAVPMAIHTKWATVAVFGHELVSKRDLLVLTKCLTMPEWEEHDHGVRVVVFRDDNYPVNEGRVVGWNKELQEPIIPSRWRDPEVPWGESYSLPHPCYPVLTVPGVEETIFFIP